MKNKLVVVFLAFIIFAFLAGCQQINNNKDYLRIHIRAHSNEQKDQVIKYEIKDLAINHLTPFLAECTDKNSAVQVLVDNKCQLESIIDSYLQENNFDYSSEIIIDTEFFPTRYYGEYLLPSDYYDAVIINLGQAKGDNWWCVVYPPLCFVSENNSGESIVYKSKIKEIINAFFK